VSIFTRAFNKLGYDSLARRFPGASPPQGQRFENGCVQFGSMRYDWCVTIIVAQEGLWLQARPPLQGTQEPIHVPWAEVREARSTRLYWRRAVRLICGDPAAGAVTVWQPVWEAAAPLWEAARAGGAPAAPPGPQEPSQGGAPAGARGEPPA
jgi:hypothetical protein